MNVEELRVWTDTHHSELRALGVASLRVFGSVARNEAGPASDVDLLVEFEGPATFDRFMDLEEWLGASLGRPIDLATPRALRSSIREAVLREAIRLG
jgi:predicted nucleotidyltransferase